LTESQLWQKLAAAGHTGDDVREAVERCKREGYVDDVLFARLYIEGKTRSVGNARLVGELVRRGIDRERATHAVESADRGESERLQYALSKMLAKRPSLAYGSAARALERLGFPAPAIYRELRKDAAERFGTGDTEDSRFDPP
jgi:SOS response regulatory protein OraA/RecX